MMGMFLTLFMIIARKTMIQVFIDDAERSWRTAFEWSLRCSFPHRLSESCFLCINTIQAWGRPFLP